MDGTLDLKPASLRKDGRRDSRRRVLFGGKLLYGEEGLTQDCAIRDLSDVGAKVRLASPAPLPADVMLIELRSGIAFECRVVWRRSPEYGLELLASHDLKDSNDRALRIAKNIWLEHAIR